MKTLKSFAELNILLAQAIENEQDQIERSKAIKEGRLTPGGKTVRRLDKKKVLSRN